MRLAKGSPAPDGWKKVRNRAGYFRQSFRNGQIICRAAYPDQADDTPLWWLGAPRGDADASNDPKAGSDWWGPWETNDETVARQHVEDMHAKLQKVGWFKPWEGGEDYERMVDRLPRSHYMPDYMLLASDRRRAGAGKARSKSELRIGGADLVIDTDGHGSLFGEKTTRVDLIAKHAGEPANRVRNVRFHLDAESLDVLIEDLIAVRQGMATDEAANATYKLADRAGGGHAEDGGPVPPEQLHGRYHRMVETTKAVNAVVEGLLEGALKRPADLALFETILRILGAGDRITALKVEAAN